MGAPGPTDTELDAAQAQREEQLEAARRERHAALQERARDAGAFRRELEEQGFDNGEALQLTEHMLGWYYEGEPPWAC